MILRSLRRAAWTITFAILAANASAQLAEVTAADAEIVLRLAASVSEPVSVFAAAVHEGDEAARTRPPVWAGVPNGTAITLSRFDGPTDRLYSRFQITDASGRPIGPRRYVTDLSRLSRSDAALPRPDSVKGLQCVVDLDDAVALGVKHAAVNVSLTSLYDPSGDSPIWCDVDGVRVAAREAAMAHLDATVKRMTDAGMRVNLILLNHVPPPGAPATPLRHPNTDPEPPNRIGAFNLTDAEGVRVFRGLVELLAERYSRPDAAHGLVAGYIVGNEVQSHYDWYNLGDAAPETVIREYAKAVRIADLAVRRFHPDARVFVSLDHNWTRRHRPESTRSMPGRFLLDRLHAE
ncbi:MAG TPA: DUF5722 domain-containing protein, partial [Planctomycetaceae bacterium]